MLIRRKKIVITDPTRNAGRVMGPTPVGIKNPITTDAARILEISAEYPERFSICFSFSVTALTTISFYLLKRRLVKPKNTIPLRLRSLPKRDINLIKKQAPHLCTIEGTDGGLF